MHSSLRISMFYSDTKHKLMPVLKKARGTYFLNLQALLGPKAGFRGQAGRVEVVVFLATSLFQVCLELFSSSPIGGSIIREQYEIWGNHLHKNT